MEPSDELARERARAKWVALERFDALGDREIQQHIRESYDLVFAKLTKKQQAEIQTKKR